DDLRYALEEVSGLGLQRFFNQWCFHPGVPHVDVGLNWSEGGSALEVTLKQTQHIDGYNPAFFFTCPIWVKTADGKTTTLEVDVDGKAATKSFPLSSPPVVAAVDPYLTVLADWNVDQPANRWREQLDQGPTIAAKMQALAAIEKLGENGLAPDLAAKV